MCLSKEFNTSQIYAKEDGDIIIYGIFPNSLSYSSKLNQCSNLSLENIQLTQAMVYAVDNMVNGNPNLLPGLKLGFIIVDSCSSSKLAMTALSTSLLLSKLRYTTNLPCGISSQTFNADTYVNHYLQDVNSNLIKGSPLLGVIGEKLDDITTLLASYTSSLQLSQISYYSFNSVLNNRRLYPNFYRVSPPIHAQIQAIIDIVAKFKWNWISVIVASTNSDDSIMQTLNIMSQQQNICIYHTATIYDNTNTSDMIRTISVLKNASRSNVIALVGEERIIYRFLKEAEKQSLTGKTWIGSYSWFYSLRIMNISADIIGGALGIKLRRNSLNEFGTYLNRLNLCHNNQNPWFVKAWQEKLYSIGISNQILVNKCELDDDLKHRLAPTFYSVKYIAAFVIDAVLALAYALHNKLGCNKTHCPPIDGYQFHKDHQLYNQFVKNVTFKITSSDYFHFGSDGSSRFSFDIVNFKSIYDANISAYKINPSVVGSWKEKSGLSLNEQSITWNGNKPWFHIPLSRCSDDCQPGYYLKNDANATVMHQGCCWLCLPCQQHSITTLFNQRKCIQCSNFTFSNENKTDCIEGNTEHFNWQSLFAILYYFLMSLYTITLLFIWTVIIRNRHTPIVKGSNVILSYILLFFATFCLVVAVMDIVPNSEMLCNARIYVIGFYQIGLQATVVIKTIQIWLIFRQSINRALQLTKITQTRYQVVFIIATLVFVLGLAFALSFYKPVLLRKQISTQDQIHLVCLYSNSPSVMTIFAALGILEIASFIVAFKARSLPENFNEARFIFISTLLLFCVSLTTVPVYLSSTGEIQMIIGFFSNLISGVITLSCFFIPKIFIIYFRPELNTPAVAIASVTNFTFKNDGFSICQPKSNTDDVQEN